MNSVITLTGTIGSGKSEVSKIVAKRLRFKEISTGFIQRQIAKERNITPLELNQFSMQNREIDDRLDGYLRELNNTGEPCVIDSRLAWFFVEDSFKVFIQADSKIAAERIFLAQRTEEKNFTLGETLRRNEQRQQMERKRFVNLYGVDFLDISHYDLVLDSSHKTREEIAEEIIIGFCESQKQSQ